MRYTQTLLSAKKFLTILENTFKKEFLLNDVNYEKSSIPAISKK